MLNRSKAAPVDGAVFVAIYVIVKSFSLLTRKDLLYDFFCCFLKLRSSLGCLDRRWAEGAVCGSPSFCVTSELVKGAPSVCVCAALTAWLCEPGWGCMSSLFSPIPISTVSISPSCMGLPAPSTMVGMEPWAAGTPVGIACEPKEVPCWKMGQIHFVLWPNNFLSCQFIEKWLGRGKQNKKAHLTSFNSARGVLISHAFFGPLFLVLWSAV